MDQNIKPVDRWLGLGGVVVGVVLYLLPEKTPATVVVCTALIFVLLVHPVWKFWWIEDAAWRRLVALGLLIASLLCLALFVWPVPTGSASVLREAVSSMLRLRLSDQWLQRGLGVLAASLIFAATSLSRRAWVRFTHRKPASPALPKGFLEHKADAEAAINALPVIVLKLSSIMEQVGPAIDRDKNASASEKHRSANRRG